MFHVLRPRLALFALIAVLASSVACGSSTSPSEQVTESFSGLVLPTGSTWHVFTASGGGEVNVTLTSLSPVSTITVGVGLGLSNGSASCNLQYAQESFKVGTVWTTNLNTKGSYCVAVYDIGQVGQNTNYTLKVTHP